MRLVWTGIAALWQKRYLSRIWSPLKNTRAEQVIYEHWRRGAEMIKRLGKKREAMSWFILTGERCGKTTLLASAKLPLMSHKMDIEAGVPTRTLRWWFFKNVSFMDTASDFLVEKPGVQAAWKKLAQWCGRLNAPTGVVVCISCHDLLENNPLALHQQARRVRGLLEPMAKTYRRKLPVSIVLTECDRLAGFTLWANQLSAEQRQQALGHAWQTAPVVDRQDPQLLDPLFEVLSNGLALSRMSMLNGALPDAQAGEILALNNNIAALQKSLHQYVTELCETDAWFAGTQLTGIWLTASVESSQQHTERDGMFVQQLLTHALPVSCQRQPLEALNPRQRWCQQCRNPALTALVTALLLGSAWQTRTLMVPADGGDIASLVQRLEHNEKWKTQPIRYLPFYLILQNRHEELERALVNSNQHHVNDINQQISLWRHEFYRVAAPQKRLMILQLAQTIKTRQAMLDGESLQALIHYPEPPAQLSLLPADAQHGDMEKRALTQAILRFGKIDSGIKLMQSTLLEWVSSDEQFNWLVADNSDIRGLPLTQFWREANSNAQLSGIWLREGESVLNQHVMLIQQASGKNETLPAITAFWQQWPQLKQQAWMAFMMEMARENALLPGQKANTTQLLALLKGEDPNSLFMRRAIAELADINHAQTQPWLAELRRVQSLEAVTGPFPLLRTAAKKERDLRGSLRHQLFASEWSGKVTQTDRASWQQWRDSMAQAVNQAVMDKGVSPALTEGLLAKDKTSQATPLSSLHLSWAQLRKQFELSGNIPGHGAVWSLLESQINMLTAHAMASSACWLEDNWHTKVLQPLANQAANRDTQNQQDRAWRYISDFFKNSAVHVLHSTPAGLQPLSYQGHSMPLSPEFLEVVNHVVAPEDLLLLPQRDITRIHDDISRVEASITQQEAQRSRLEKQITRLEVASLPATVPGGARLMPIGTRLDLHCARQSPYLESSNLLEKALFSASPGQCNAVTLTVSFPGAELKYRYEDDSAWSDFISDFTEGERLFSLDEFSSDHIQALRDVAVDKVLVRFQLSGAEKVLASWHQWQNLTDEIALLQEERDGLQSEQFALQQPAYFQGKLTSLPTSVAMCVN
ncbi:type VI secretion protein IcmF/TssM N-terminal domain-containing protein [Pantoea sp. SS70]|uniref:type VI secretion protein IcmF/TssM N-terminal domain-containing protein n=1 Tax=Pantoea sp. SS70 TaxID=3024247 RepID=UPI002452FC8C|nr:type VI secretion protein IcmF/TssM N-terminal domain-containing protein [Pantoea sp. SS70]WGK60103.1 type VI secretion protein IcmF/TssM N-terminal domain-containing protein [Pantoea sp. SS70]